MPSDIEHPDPRRHAIVADLRRRVSRLEGLADEAATAALPFGVPAIEAHLPAGGLSLANMHEITPAREADLLAAFGFLLALMARFPPPAPLLLVLASKTLSRCGAPYGAGLAAFGLDPARLSLVEAANESEALWATEEALRARGPAAVASVFSGKLDLKTCQRLLHAAREAGTPLLLLRPNGDSVPTAATRWRIAAASGARDRFGGLTGPRWHAHLERCRNGRPGSWLLEFDHATHRFGLAAAMAGAALACGGAAEASAHTG